MISDVRASTDGEDVVKVMLNGEPIPRVESPSSGSPDPPPPPSENFPALLRPPYMDKLEAVLALHTSQRMKPPSSTSASPSPSSSTLTLSDQEILMRTEKDKTATRQKGRHAQESGSQSTKQRQGVSIPSQRRWLFYWSLLLAGEGGWIRTLWDLDSNPVQHHITATSRPKVLLKCIRVRVRPLSGFKANILRVANKVIERTGTSNKNAPPRVLPNSSYTKSGGSKRNTEETEHLWISLARYDDALVAALERRERATRADSEDVDGKTNLSFRRRRADKAKIENQSGVKDVGNPTDNPDDFFEGSNWDKEKMIRHFAKMGLVSREKDVINSIVEKVRLETFNNLPSLRLTVLYYASSGVPNGRYTFHLHPSSTVGKQMANSAERHPSRGKIRC